MLRISGDREEVMTGVSEHNRDPGVRSLNHCRDYCQNRRLHVYIHVYRFDGRWHPGGDSRDRDTGAAATLHTPAANSH